MPYNLTKRALIECVITCWKIKINKKTEKHIHWKKNRFFELRKLKLQHTYTHIHNWLLQPISQDYWASSSHHVCCVCVNFIHKWRDLLYKVDYERQIFFWETFHGSFITYSLEFLPEICWEEITEEILFVFCFDVWPRARTLALRLISQHTTY